MSWTAVIGLEIHAELLTNTKIFCSCGNEFGAGENARCCPGCLAMPGTLPLMNRAAVEMAIAAGLAMGCRIAERTTWDRKNYFYPDLPKAYQNSQLFEPICVGGGLEIGGRFIRLNRIHLEEDAGKLIHDDAEGVSLVDLNRGGVPLIEIVTEPDIRSSGEAAEFLAAVRRALVYAGVNDGRLEQGHMRCDANISVMPEGAGKYGTRVEVKNLNSLKSVTRAIEHEIARQISLIESGGAVLQETRRFNDNHGRTVAMRSKEDAQDYRYFPDPDLLPVVIDDAYIDAITIPELPGQKLARFMETYGLPLYDAGLLSENRVRAAFVDECVKLGASAKAVANWLLSDIAKELNEKEIELDDTKITPQSLTALILMIEKAEISSNAGKKVVAELLGQGGDPAAIVERLGLKQVSDDSALRTWAQQAIENNPKSAADYRAGKTNALGFLVGQCMKASAGKGNPGLFQKILIGLLEQ